MTSKALDEGMARIAKMLPDQQRNYMSSRVLIRGNIGTEKHRLEEIDALVLTEGTLRDNLRSWELLNFDLVRGMENLPSLLSKRQQSVEKVEVALTEIRNRITWNIDREHNYQEKLVALADDVMELREYREAASRILSYIEKSRDGPAPSRNKPCPCESGLDYKKCCAMNVGNDGTGQHGS